MILNAILLSIVLTASYLYSTVFHDSETAAIFQSDIRPLKWSSVNFLHTTDTHGWYSGHLNQKIYSANWGDFVSFISHMREIADSNDQDLLLVDTGDKHDGNGLSDATTPNGRLSLPIFLEVDYDLITIGNHELYLAENSIQEYELVARHYGEKYISTNVDYILEDGTLVPMGNRYRYFTTPNQNLRVLAFGFLFDFTRFNSRANVSPITEVIKQAWFLEILQEYQSKTDLLVVIGHIPITPEWYELRLLHETLRAFFPHTKIHYFGGHSHIRDYRVFDEESTGLQSGRFCETVGWASINMSSSYSKTNDLISTAKESFSRSYLDFNLNSFMFHTDTTSVTFNTDRGLKVKEDITNARKELNLNEVVGYVANNYYMDYVPYPHPKNLYSLLADAVLPTLRKADEVAASLENNRIILINTGSIRYDLYKGAYTKDSGFIISPFKNDWVSMKLPYEVAIQVAPVLNNRSYILSDDSRRMDLVPPHHFFAMEPAPLASDQLKDQSVLVDESDVAGAKRLPRGYLTHDDFGTEGDDTPHYPVINYPIPNVIESHIIYNKESEVELIFYDFITINVIQALEAVNYKDYGKADIKFHSNETVDFLLANYIKSNSL